MERARELIAPYTVRPGVRGIYLVGSASRPYRDEISDYDFEVAMDDDAYLELPDDERHVFVIDPGPPRRVKHEFFLRPWKELEALRDSTRDLDHYPFQHAAVLFDPAGELAPLLADLGRFPADVRETRARVHFVEFRANTLSRSLKGLERGDPLNTRLSVSDAVIALVKLLFVVRGRWPSLRHWARQELSLAGVGDDMLDRMEALLLEPSAERVRDLVERVERWLDAEGMGFHRDPMALHAWAFLSEEGKRAFVTWGAR
jgi:hypothetical protein